EKQRLVAAQNRQIEAMQRTVNSIDPVTAALARLEKQEAALRGLRAAGGLDDAGLAAGLEKIAAKRRDIEGTGGAINKLGLTSKEARENVLQLGNALSTGNWRVAAHNIAEIGVNAGGAARGVIGVLAPIGLLAAAIGGVTAAAYLGSKEQGEYNKALIMTGNYAGTSASGLGEMARQVSNTVGTTGAAAEVLATLAGKGDLASESFVAITQAALSMEEATGRAVGDTVAEFVRLGEDPVKASKALNEQYNYLTASVYSQIKALEEQGDHAGAVKLATEAYADAINQRTPKILENLGWIERAWDGVARAAKRAWDDAKSIGRQDIDSQIADVERRLAQLDQGGFGLVGNRDESRNRLREELDMLRERKKAMEDDARTAGERARAEQAAQNAIDRIDARSRAALTNQQKRAKELEQYKKDLQAIREVNPNDDRLQQATIDREIANINAKYKDQKGSAGSVDLRAANAAKNSLAEITATYRNAQKELEASQRAGVISAESYAQQRISIIQQERDEVTHAYEREIAALEAARAKQGTSAAQRIQLDQKIADARSAMVKAQKDADTELAILAANEDGRLARQKAATKAYVDQLERQRAALAAAGTRAANSLGLGDRQAGLQSSLDGATDRFNDERAKLLDRRRTAPDKYSQEDYKRDLVILAEAEDKYRDTVISNYDKITKAQGDWRSGASSAFQTYLESARDVAGQTKSLFTSAFSSMEDSIANFATTGKLSFSDFAKSILADMARIATRAAASQALSSLFGGFFGGGNAAAQSGVDNLVSNSGLFANGGAFAGGVQMFATGGAFTNSVVSTPTAFGMSGGRMGVMGEAGPEAVMPLTRTSSGALGVRAMGGSSSQINVEVNIASDGSANVSSSQPGLDQFGRDIGTFVEQKYRQLLARDLRRDGAIGRAING
ncbi:TPA: phage tail tape measure protein, partial [Pseudomonas aeruginosa]